MLSKSKLKYYSFLNLKKNRNKENKFIAEGKRLIVEGLNSSFTCEIILANSSFINSNKNFINGIKKRGFNFCDITDSELAKLTSTDNPQGIIAIFNIIPQNKKFDKDKIIVGLENISDPGNLGTILRSCDWFGIKTIMLSKGCSDLYNPKVIRASMGAIFHLNIFERQNLIERAEELKKLNYQILVADMEGEDYKNVDLNNKSFIIFCNEANGPSKNLNEAQHQKITIPSKGKIESLNVSAAAAVILSRLNF